jgi:hypothetical protein
LLVDVSVLVEVSAEAFRCDVIMPGRNIDGLWTLTLGGGRNSNSDKNRGGRQGMAAAEPGMVVAGA